MSGVIPLTRVQIGREGTPGSAVDATEKFRIEGAFIKDNREILRVPENVGLLVPTDRITTPKLAAEMTIPENIATFEQFLHILEMGVRTVAGAADGAGTGIVYTYNLPTTAQLTPKSYTIEGGNDQQAVVAEYCFAEEFSLSGKAGEPLKFTAKLFGRQVTDDTFTAAISLIDVEEMLFQKCKFYVNDVGDGWADSEISNYLLGFNLSVVTGYKARFTAGGNLYFSYLKQTDPKYSLQLTVEHDSNAETEIDAAQAETPRAVRILCEGSSLVTPGTYTYKTLILDLAGTYMDVPQPEDDDGSAIMNFNLEGGYNDTLSTMGKFIMVTETDMFDDIS